ncbi:serine/threonine protein kinase [Streptomyces purpurascens]
MSGRSVAAPSAPVDPGDWPYSRDSMVKAILASATPERDDRLFPGDVAQFSDGGGLGLAHGAAGVLYALDTTGAERYEEGERWLLTRTAPAPVGTPLGLYDGLAGVALVLDRLGHRQRALDLVEGILAERWQNLSSDLHGGLAGLGLVLGRLAETTGETELRDRADEAARILVQRLAEPLPTTPRRRAGLLRGATGPALFLLRQYEWTGRAEWLQAAAVALGRDLESCVTREGGSLEVDEGWRTLPYLGDGSAELGMVLDDLVAHAPDLAGELEPARSGCATPPPPHASTRSPGSSRAAPNAVPPQPHHHAGRDQQDRLAGQIAGLGWFAMAYQGQLAFPGHQMMRLSMDLATGTAGCLLALGAALDPATDAHLPFLPPPDRAAYDAVPRSRGVVTPPRPHG